MEDLHCESAASTKNILIIAFCWQKANDYFEWQYNSANIWKHNRYCEGTTL